MKIDINKVNIGMANEGITISGLSKKSKISRQYLSKIFKNKATAKPITVGKIARALNLKVENIVREQKPEVWLYG